MNKICYVLIAFIVAQMFQAHQFSKMQPIDRYQLVQLGSARRDQYLLDKESGDVYHITLGVDGQNVLIRLEDYYDLEEYLEAVAEKAKESLDKESNLK